jgi:hypothetical protein
MRFMREAGELQEREDKTVALQIAGVVEGILSFFTKMASTFGLLVFRPSLAGRRLAEPGTNRSMTSGVAMLLVGSLLATVVMTAREPDLSGDSSLAGRQFADHLDRLLLADFSLDKVVVRALPLLLLVSMMMTAVAWAAGKKGRGQAEIREVLRYAYAASMVLSVIGVLLFMLLSVTGWRVTGAVAFFLIVAVALLHPARLVLPAVRSLVEQGLLRSWARPGRVTALAIIGLSLTWGVGEGGYWFLYNAFGFAAHERVELPLDWYELETQPDGAATKLKVPITLHNSSDGSVAIAPEKLKVAGQVPLLKPRFLPEGQGEAPALLVLTANELKWGMLEVEVSAADAEKLKRQDGLDLRVEVPQQGNILGSFYQRRLVLKGSVPAATAAAAGGR